MIITLQELIDAVIIVIALGYIFKNYMRVEGAMESFKIACIVTAPAIILHELAHKFVALFFGYQATFHAAYSWLALGAILSALKTGILFFVPAFVSITCGTGCSQNPLSGAIIALSGPLANLLIWGTCTILLKKATNTRTRIILHLTKKINMFLFVFNMLPIPGFDGFQVYTGIYHALL